VKRHDYLPFGEELFAGTGNRTTAQGYSVADGVRQKFTSKERDAETGLDYFIARYHSAAQGRFVSPDSFGGDPLNPQSMNLYTYVQNNPLKYIDPTGHKFVDPIKALQDAAKKALKEAKLRALEEQWRMEDYGSLYIPVSQPQQVVEAASSNAVQVVIWQRPSLPHPQLRRLARVIHRRLLATDSRLRPDTEYPLLCERSRRQKRR
jgi:RHS repeat-associated protein